jgi:hypothetical protein
MPPARYANRSSEVQKSVGAGLQISSTMNENFGKPARTGVCLRHATRTEVWLMPPARYRERHAARTEDFR